MQRSSEAIGAIAAALAKAQLELTKSREVARWHPPGHDPCGRPCLPLFPPLERA